MVTQNRFSQAQKNPISISDNRNGTKKSRATDYVSGSVTLTLHIHQNSYLSVSIYLVDKEKKMHRELDRKTMLTQNRARGKKRI